VRAAVVRNRFGKTKTESSQRPVPLHPPVLSALLEWRAQSGYAAELDFLFPSTRFKDSKALSPDSILEKSIRLGKVAGKFVVSQVYIKKGFIGGPDRDRTDDLFHAMLWVKAHIIDLMRLMRRINRQNRPSRRYLLPKCYQIFNQWEAGRPVGS